MSMRPVGALTPCPWCHHSSLGHSYPSTPGTKVNTSVCQVSVRQVMTNGSVFYVACGCTQSGEPRPDPQANATVLSPPPVCVLCDEFAVIGGLWCSPEHRDQHLAMAKSAKDESPTETEEPE